MIKINNNMIKIIQTLKWVGVEIKDGVEVKGDASSQTTVLKLMHGAFCV